MTRMQIPDDWLDRGITDKDLSVHTVRADRWDRDDLDRMLTEIATFAAARDTLGDFTPTGGPAMADTFWELFKANPDLRDESEVLPSHLINRTVMGELEGLAETSRLRRFSVGDDVQASLSASALEPDLETIFDRLRQEQKQAEELEQTLRDLASAAMAADGAQADLDEMLAAMKAKGKSDEGDGQGEGEDGEGQGEGEGLSDEQKEQLEAAAEQAAKLRERYEELKAQAESQAQAFEQAMDSAAPSIMHDLREAIGREASNAQVVHDTATAWGLDPGELQRMDANERLAMAEKLKSDRFRQIAKRFGALKNLQLSEQQRRTTHINEEIVDVEIGADLSRVLPSEMMNLRHPLLRRNFYRKFAQRGLLQYGMEGTERLGHGGIIFCEDGSGSMSGEREIFSKAVMLCLLDLAKRQKRTMHVVHFGGPGSFRTISFTKPEDFSFPRIIEAAEIFFGGGTDFETPMREALRILQEEFAQTGGVNADVVFMTDDECWVREAFMEEYLDEMHRMSATTWGITATGNEPSPEGALSMMSEGKTATVVDFLSGNDIRNVFRGVS